MRAYYRAEGPFVGNVSLVADFDKTVEVTSDRATAVHLPNRLDGALSCENSGRMAARYPRLRMP